MAISTGTHNVEWRFQGIRSQCWLTCIEMLMQARYNCIYGLLKNEHSVTAMAERKKNKGSHIALHAEHYDLVVNATLDRNATIDHWNTALSMGPVIAVGRLGMGRIGWGMHAILIVGVSRDNNLAYYNPNMYTFVSAKSNRLSYMSLRRCNELVDFTDYDGPYWQTHADVLAANHEVRLCSYAQS
ncbi:hypothetical protein GTP38_11570 [Duganella sp. FT94W]|uniref:Peptidase C39-like domain-containing protein n=1 Tax=Duganella lactea TaxID=2692173 RepID=A0ABW9V8E5_9BURK|nr:papain-like cysteine protease family protein [Duganella lactea]MYM34974.1 hypothetical protein [Duganella lactea]